MEVTKMYPENLGKREQYAMMKGQVSKMVNAEGSIIDVKAWIRFNDVDAKTGEIKDVLVIQDQNGELFGTISQVFISQFEDIVSFFGEDVGQISVYLGRSKAGREFVGCNISIQ